MHADNRVCPSIHEVRVATCKQSDKKKKKENQRAYTVANLAILATPLIQVKHAVNIPQMLQCYSWYGSTASTPTTSAQ